MTFTDNKLTKCVFMARDQTLVWHIVKSVSTVFWGHHQSRQRCWGWGLVSCRSDGHGNLQSESNISWAGFIHENLLCSSPIEHRQENWYVKYFYNNYLVLNEKVFLIFSWKPRTEMTWADPYPTQESKTSVPEVSWVTMVNFGSLSYCTEFNLFI